MFPNLPLDVLPDYIENSMNISMKLDTKLTITVYNIIVGSHMDDMDLLEQGDEYKRNHEFPQVVKNILYDPLLQFSPDMMEFISHLDNVVIRQILILIDPMYETKKEYSGLELQTILEDDKFVQDHKIYHNEFKSTSIKSIVEPIIISENVNEHNIMGMIEQITSYSSKMPVIVNIIDCTSFLLRELFANNSNPYVYISVPNCLLIDDNIQYMPVITYDRQNLRIPCDNQAQIPCKIKQAQCKIKPNELSDSEMALIYKAAYEMTGNEILLRALNKMP